MLLSEAKIDIVRAFTICIQVQNKLIAQFFENYVRRGNYRAFFKKGLEPTVLPQQQNFGQAQPGFTWTYTGTKFHLILTRNERATAYTNIHLFRCKHCDVINLINSY